MCISMTKPLSTHGLITVSNLVFCQLAHLALCLLQGKCPHEKQPGPNLLQFLPFFTVFMLIGFPGDDPSHSSWCSTSHLDYGFSLTKNSILKKKNPRNKTNKNSKKKNWNCKEKRGRDKTYWQMLDLSRGMLVYEHPEGQLLYSNCLCSHRYPRVMLPAVRWRIRGQMLVTLVMQVLPLPYLTKMCQEQIKQ